MQAVRTNVIGSDNVIEAAAARRRAVGGLPEHRQGGLPDQRDGHVQGADGEGRPGATPATTRDSRHDGRRHALRQRDVLAAAR